MSGPWFVEVLDRHQRVQQRLRVTQWPVVVGRGYDCDLVLDDPHLAPRHVEFSLADDGGVMARDLGSLNGLRRTGARAGSGSGSGTDSGRDRGEAAAVGWPLKAGEAVEAGLTRLRVVSAATPVAPERPLDAKMRIPMWAPVVLVLGLAALQAFDTWFSTLENYNAVSAASGVVVLVLGLLAWAGVWSLLTRLVQGTSRFVQHLAWASGFVLVSRVAPWLIETLAFAMDWSWLVTSQRLAGVAWVALGLLGHLRIALGPLSVRTRSVVAGLALVGLGLVVADSWQSQHRIWPNTFMTTMRPSAWRLAGERSLDDFYQAARSQQAQVDALRKIDGEGDEE